MNNLVLLDGNKISGGINYITPECYSTEERVVGCWADGKPLYLKTYLVGDFSIPTNLISGLNIQTVVDLYVIDFSSNIEKRYDLSYNDSTTLIGDIPSGMHWFWWVIVKYTKKTDTEGSGVWTPSGIPAVHYSEQEHIIGTWIDGSTLYERTFVFPDNVSVTNWTTIMTLEMAK